MKDTKAARTKVGNYAAFPRSESQTARLSRSSTSPVKAP